MKDSPLKPLCDNCSPNGEAIFCWLPSEPDGDAAIEFSKGSVLFNEGQAPEGVYVLRTGRVKLTTSSCDARVLITDIAGPGYVLGLSAVVSGGVHETTASSSAPRARPSRGS